MNEIIKLSKRQATEVSKLCKAYYYAPSLRGGGDTPAKVTARKAYGEKSAQLAKRHFGIELTAEEAFRAVNYHQTDWTMRNPGTLRERLIRLENILKGFYEPDPEVETDQPKNLFSTIYFVHDYAAQGNRPVGTTECGSVSIKDTPRGLYRLLYLSRPKGLDFDDMYKTGGLICLCSPDYQFVAEAELWKYALALRFLSTSEHITGRRSSVQCGVPGVGNGIEASSPLLKQWCDTLVLCLRTRWDVYPGNNFTV